MSDNPAKAITEDGFEEFFKDLVRSYSPDAEFVYANDIKCAGCQACCKGVPVSLYLSDIFRISAHLKMTPRDFFVKYGGFVHATDANNNEIYFFTLNAINGCPFLTTGGCSIHAIKPMICRAYPVTTPNRVRLDIIQNMNKTTHAACAIHQVAPNTYIIPDISLLIDIDIGATVMYEYILEVGSRSWSPRIADGFIHREMAFRRRKDERDLRANRISVTVADSMKELIKTN
jgi:Fe-S-cluster containining protein